MDSVSTMFPALGGHLFRMTAIFKEKVDIKLLEKAIPNLAESFPIMFTHLERTCTGYVHRTATNYDVIINGEKWIKLPTLLDTDKPSFRVYVENNLVSVDFFHGNADGNDASAFMGALVDSYCGLLEGKALPTLPIPNQIDLKDPYKLYYKKSKASSMLEKPSYELKLKKEPYDYHRFSCFTMNISDVKAFTKSYGCSINDFLCAIYYKAIVNATKAKTSKKPVTISVGINLRPFYKSNTHRNFDFYCNARMGEECKYSFDNTIKTIQKQIKNSLRPENVQAGIAAVHDADMNPIVKYMPREIKNFIIKNVYHAISDNGVTSALSNVGYRKISADSEKHLERLEMYLNIFDSKVNAAAIGSKDKLAFGITYNSKDKSIDNEIAKTLKEFNLQYEYDEREFY